MRRKQKMQLLEILGTLREAQEMLGKQLNWERSEASLALLADCQDTAMQIGAVIETSEGENCGTVEALEAYCEELYQVSQLLSEIPEEEGKSRLHKSLLAVEAGVRGIPVRLEILFLPYKAAMWDSMESVWRAAEADPGCRAYVVPIPYYDKSGSDSQEACHYEGDLLPEEVPVIPWQSYSLAEHLPDIVYIHNPYDEANLVTTIDPRYYSRELKKYTECLVYIPYYLTTGIMSKEKGSTPACFHADYIILQAEQFRQYFHERIPEERFLALGSPKLDRILRVCASPPRPLAAWQRKMQGKKVYFYNTSIHTMLADTKAFLQKLAYVFQCFERQEDACLLWRPHPLLESTFAAMRTEEASCYAALKHYFLEQDFGIYDDTSDVQRAIALSDAYIGDETSSVVPMFGAAGKPVFILDNQLSKVPAETAWRREVIPTCTCFSDLHWIVTQRNQLYHAQGKELYFRHFLTLSAEEAENYSYGATMGDGRSYLCPVHAQEIAVIQKGGLRKIPLKGEACSGASFAYMLSNEEYLFLIPDGYPSLVRLRMADERIDYFEIPKEILTLERAKEGMRGICVGCICGAYLYFPSPEDNRVLRVHMVTGDWQIVPVGSRDTNGIGMACEQGMLWILPCFGTVIRRWDPETGEVTEYRDMPEELRCRYPVFGKEKGALLFNELAFSGNKVYLSAGWADRCICLDQVTGETEEWAPPFPMPDIGESSACLCQFLNQTGEDTWLIFVESDRRLYEVNLRTNDYREIELTFDIEELKRHEPGFAQRGVYLPYACVENPLNTLERFLAGKTLGAAFDREKQLAAYNKIAVNSDGTCGEKIHRSIVERLGRK